MKNGYSDLYHLDRRLNPNLYPDNGKPFDFTKPRFEPTGELRRDILTLIQTRHVDTVKAMASTLGTYDKKVSHEIREMVVDGTLTFEEVYAALPALKYKHQCMALASRG